MKQNDVFIGMSFEEYDNYKKYLEFKKDGTVASFVTRHQYAMGGGHSNFFILNESETIDVLKSELLQEKELVTMWCNNYKELEQKINSIEPKKKSFF